LIIVNQWMFQVKEAKERVCTKIAEQNLSANVDSQVNHTPFHRNIIAEHRKKIFVCTRGREICDNETIQNIIEQSGVIIFEI
jgi:translation initiation factor IF-3